MTARLFFLYFSAVWAAAVLDAGPARAACDFKFEHTLVESTAVSNQAVTSDNQVIDIVGNWQPVRQLAQNDRIRKYARPIGRLDICARYADGKDRIGYCTGNLISGNRVLTAAHCTDLTQMITRDGIPAEEILEIRLLMGYEQVSDTADVRTYRVTQPPRHPLSRQQDSQVLSVEGDANAHWGAVGLVRAAPIEEGERLILVHHPFGITKQFNPVGCFLRGGDISAGRIGHVCETLGGSSGALLARESDLSLVGLHVSGGKRANEPDSFNRAVPIGPVAEALGLTLAPPPESAHCQQGIGEIAALETIQSSLVPFLNRQYDNCPEVLALILPKPDTVPARVPEQPTETSEDTDTSEGLPNPPVVALTPEAPVIGVDIETGYDLQPGHSLGVKSYAFSPDGTRLVTASPFKIVVWSVEEARPLRQIVPKGEVGALAFDTNSRQVYVATDGRIDLYDLENGRHLRAVLTGMHDPEQPDYPLRIGSFDVAEDADFVVTNGYPGNSLASVLRWRISSGAAHPDRFFDGSVAKLILNEKADKIGLLTTETRWSEVDGFRRNTPILVMLDPVTGFEITRQKIVDFPRSLSFGGSESLLATDFGGLAIDAEADRFEAFRQNAGVALLPIERFDEDWRAFLDGSGSWVDGLAFTASDDFLAASLWNGELIFWEMYKLRPLPGANPGQDSRLDKGTRGRAHLLKVGGADRLISAPFGRRSERGQVQFISTPDGPRVNHPTTPESARTVAISPDGGTVAINNSDGIRVISTNSGHRVPLDSSPSLAGNAMGFSADGTRLITVGGSRIDVFDTETGAQLTDFAPQSERYTAVDTFGDVAALLTQDGQVRFYNIVQQQKMQSLDIGLKVPFDLQFSRNGRMLAVLGLDGVEVFETSGGKNVLSRAMPYSAGDFRYYPVMALSSEGGLLAYSDGTQHKITLYEVPGGRQLGQLALYPDDAWASSRGDKLQISDQQVLNRLAYMGADGSLSPVSQAETIDTPTATPTWSAAALLRGIGQGDAEARHLLIKERGRSLDLSLRKEVQTVLQGAGYYSGAIDAILGAGSQTAIMRYLNR